MVQVGVTPNQLRRAAADMGDLSTQVSGILRRLESGLSGYGAAWGNDSYGNSFAAGARGYNSANSNLQDGLGKLSQTLESYSSGQYRAADELQQQDHF
ncbi:WXG100 family type VII secretion target [Nocardia sp. NEAU-G5]|uniref:WXG100 family type VII secretion target n=1 Tax=Nocardia albiluteola TaxID=2842303 RepID=A0ABS6BAU5_9NOCA|nr:WXG100 family type VII secretion target [Nocardia albiluteola]MBU3067422.1 WXG100 family type VII secretion target [Nocardia albiluteola]